MSISREAVLNGVALYMAENAYLNDTALDVLKMVGGWLTDAPATDVVEVKRGERRTVKLNRDKGTVIVECSECGSVFDITLFACGLNYNFCPNCGADMREASGNDQERTGAQA